MSVSREPGRSLRLLFVIPGYPPVLGGAEIDAARVAGELQRAGHTVNVLTLASEGMPESGRWRDPAGVEVRTVGRRLPERFKVRLWVLVVAWTVLWSRRRYDAVHVFLPGLHGVAALLAGRIAGVPVVVKFGGPLEGLDKLRLGRVQLRTIARHASRVHILSDQMRSEFRAWGVEDERMVLIACGADTERFRPASVSEQRTVRAELGLPQEGCAVTAVGRLVSVKNIDVLIEAVARAKRRCADLYLVIAGSGPEMERLFDCRARHLDERSAFLLGHVDEATVARVLQASDVFALVSSSEGLPCALIEAMAVGLAVVVSDVPGTASLVPQGERGVRIPVRSVPALADALIRLDEDAALRERLGHAAREYVRERHSMSAVVDQYVGMYREINVARKGER